MSEMMRGLVSFPNGDLKLQDVPVPVIGQNRFAPHDVLCEVEYCGICGSDVHKFLADDAEKAKTKHVPAPVVSGHEIVSVVREVGKAVTSVKPGDRVVHEIVTFYCGHCPACLEGRYNICNTIAPMMGR
ncbi:MAG: alcohol dehydrogenase catalytic domain-containing protein, partial [Candidatus Shapirobacteria bacterium]